MQVRHGNACYIEHGLDSTRIITNDIFPLSLSSLDATRVRTLHEDADMPRNTISKSVDTRAAGRSKYQYITSRSVRQDLTSDIDQNTYGVIMPCLARSGRLDDCLYLL